MAAWSTNSECIWWDLDLQSRLHLFWKAFVLFLALLSWRLRSKGCLHLHLYLLAGRWQDLYDLTTDWQQVEGMNGVKLQHFSSLLEWPPFYKSVCVHCYTAFSFTSFNICERTASSCRISSHAYIMYFKPLSQIIQSRQRYCMSRERRVCIAQ